MFRFASPLYFLALLSLPAIWYYRGRLRGGAVLKSSAVGAVKGIRPSAALRAGRYLPALKYLAVLLLIVGLARPQWGTRQVTVTTEGINIILAVDISESMAALDFKRDGKIVNRLDAVKGVIEQFIAKREGDRIGMVVFGTHAFTQLPLTRDYGTISFILDRIEIGAAGKSTAIGDAIGISLKRIGDIESRSNIVILLTDGESNSGELSPEVAAKIAREQSVKVYTVGVGTRGKAPFLVNSPIFGKRYVYQRVSMDEEALKEIARETGGTFFRAEDTEGLERVYETIDRLEKNEVEVKTYAEYREFYRWFLFPALALLTLYGILSNTRLLRIP